MKKFTLHFRLPLIALALSTFYSCQDKVEITRRYKVFEPVYMPVAEIRGGFEVTGPAALEERGKIYLYNDYILINDPGKGIHLIDNADPESPQPIHFINIPGNFDMAVRGDYLYADSYMDLLVIDISNAGNIHIKSRIEDIFMDFNENIIIHQDSGLVIDYREVEIVEVTEDETEGGVFPNYFYWFRDGRRPVGFQEFSDMAFAVSEAANVAPPVSAGIGGSMATFTIVDEFLYIIDNSNLNVFSISNPELPVNKNVLPLDWGIETIFPYEQNLFVGSQTGMHVIDNSNPENPVWLSTFNHVFSCDPVVVSGDRAYVTLRSNNTCNGFTNELDVIDISDLANPQLIMSYPMQNPHGLGIDGQALFLCEGEGGLKIFDASDDYKIDENLKMHFTTFDAYDVIPHDNILYLIGKDGLYQFDYSDIEDIQLLSKLTFGPEL